MESSTDKGAFNLSLSLSNVISLSGTLKIGDYVTFRSLKYDSYLNAEGILSDKVFVNADYNLFDDGLFCIHLQRQYSAARELKAFMDTYFSDNKVQPDESMLKYLAALQRGRDNENKLNDMYMANKMGQVVVFGDVIQLFHVKSKKYITISADKSATAERENLLVRMDTRGNSMSWIQVAPRYKIDKPGDRILTNTEVFLKISERPNEYLHCADRNMMVTKFREINCSMEFTSWKLSIFQSSTASQDKKILVASELVIINDPESRCNVTCAQPKIENLDELTSDILVLPDVILEPQVEGVVNTGALWTIESVGLVVGGPINWKTEQVRFRHLNTGFYMSQESESSTIVDDNGCVQDATKVHLRTTDDPTIATTLFSVSEINNPDNLLRNAKPVQIGHDSMWIERGDTLENSKIALHACAEKTSAVSLLIQRYEQQTQEEDEHVKDKIAAEPLDVYCVLALRRYLKKYFDATVVPTSKYIGVIWPGMTIEEEDFFGLVMDKGFMFSQGFSIAAGDESQGAELPILSRIASRQSLLRELGVLLTILQIIHRLLPISERQELVIKRTEAEENLQGVGNKVLDLCFNVLLMAITENPENQMFVADFMPVMLSHLGAMQPLASKCVTEMLSKNMELQETKIGAREIQIFVDKLKQSKMGAMYLNLLQSCCSCQGAGVDNNQCKVAEMLFEGKEESDILIHLKKDYQNAVMEDWGASTLYIPGNRKTMANDAPIMGHMLLTVGLPEIKAHWSTKYAELTPITLYGYPDVVLDKLFTQIRTVRPRAGARSSVDLQGQSLRASMSMRTKPKTALGSTAIISNYFVAEMNLAAEMCMDRNYVAMNILDKEFPYDVLVTMLRLSLDLSVKSAALRLVTCLHIDRDPQAMTTIPCLTRTWSEIQKSAEPVLPYVEYSRRNSFALIQQICSEHLAGMYGTNWEEYSLSILDVLKKLVMFNFYGTNERLNDVISPLVRALDRRTVEFPNEPSAISRSLGLSHDYDNSGVDVSGTPVDEIPVVIKPIWQRRLLTFLESLPVMCAVLLLVMVAVAETIYQTVSGLTDTPGTPLYIFGLTVLMIFIVECGSRMYCHVVCRHSLYTFVSSIFNQIDMTVISIDIIFLCIPANTSSGGSLAKTLRLIRLLRLLRILRAARVVSKLTQVVKVDVKTYAQRFTKSLPHELEAMISAVDLLAYAQNIIDDRNLSLFLRKFFESYSETDKRTSSDLFEQVIVDSRALTLSMPDFDVILLDVLMFNNRDLVQSTLELVMSHHSMRRSLLTNAAEVQLLVSHKRERQYHNVDQMFQQLERNAETHEIWGCLQSDSDQKTNVQTIGLITDLITSCRTQRYVLEFHETYMVEVDVQNLYRNLGCYPICMKVLGLFDSVEIEEGKEMDAVSANTLHLCKLCNELLYWFLLGNEKNQEMAFPDLNFYIDTLDENINSHMILKAMFVNNEFLMKQLSHDYIVKLADKICKDGKSYHYLTLMAAICFVGDKNITKNQLQIAITLTKPGKTQQISCFLVPVDHADYELKKELMSAHLNTKDVELDALDPLLAYHLTLLEVLTNCTQGRMNITTVEAKVQSIYNYVDIIKAILDPSTLLLAKIRLGTHLLQANIEVEMKIPGFAKAAVVWELLKSFTVVLKFAQDEIRMVEKFGWEAAQNSRQKIEYIIISIMIIGAFFELYYDRKRLQMDDGTSSSDKVQMTNAEINELISFLFFKIKYIYDIDSPRLSKDHKAAAYRALVALNNSATSVLVTEIEPTHLVSMAEAEQAEDMTQETVISNKYAKFLEDLTANEAIQLKANNESQGFISVVEALPFIADNNAADVKFEGFIKKMVAHVRENFKIVNDERRLDSRCTKTTTWVIKSFRTMIENRMGMSINERDEDGGDEQDIAAAPVVAAMNSCGATTLCLDLIAVGIDETLQLEAVRLAVALLYKEGGAKEVQELMHTYLSKGDSDLFFKQCRAAIQKLISWHKWRGPLELDEGKDPELPEDIILIRFLQLMCEGHFMHNQDIMREQPHNHSFANLLDDFVEYLNCLSRIPCRTSTAAAMSVSSTILEVLQGPCSGNQAHFALNTELIETLNRMMRIKVVRDCVEEEELEMKKTAISILQGLLEGQAGKSPVYDRVLSVIHLDVIKFLSTPLVQESGEVIDENGDLVEIVPEEVSEEQQILETEAMVLLQMLCAYKPSLYDELEISRNVDDIVGSGSAFIEVYWRGEVHRKFFYIPKICFDLSKTSKDEFIELVDRKNQENKLIDLIARAHDLYREVRHQQFLKSWKLARVFSPQIQDSVTWFTFVIAILINALFVSYYYFDVNANQATMPPSKVVVVNVLNVFLMIGASCTVLSYAVVKLPVIFQTHRAHGLSVMMSIFNTATDGMLLYYLIYLMNAFFGLLLADIYMTFLLLDIIVKNSTTRDVLNAVVNPRKQLGMTLLLGLFILYIYSYFIFYYFRDDVVIGNGYCGTLWDCLKFTVCTGLRMGGGVGDLLAHSLEKRWLLDTSFFILVTVILLNIIFGIIIDTFSALRANKVERMADTTEICFVCGIENLTFDRASKQPEGFKRHVKVDHNIWNYMYFIFKLWEQDRDGDDGLEQYVRLAIEENEIFWFPMNKALCLDQGITEAEEIRDEVLSELVATETKLSHEVDHFKVHIQVVTDQIMKALKQDAAPGLMKTTISRYLQSAGFAQQKNFLQGTQAPGADTAGMVGAADIADDASQDSHQSEQESPLPTNRPNGHQVSLAIKEISGLEMPTEELNSISCKLLCEKGTYSLSSTGSKHHILHFDASHLMNVCDNALVDDHRACEVRIMQHHGSEHGGTMIALVDIGVRELLDGGEIEKIFVGIAPHQLKGKLTLIAATKEVLSREQSDHLFARGDEAEWEEEEFGDDVEGADDDDDKGDQSSVVSNSA